MSKKPKISQNEAESVETIDKEALWAQYGKLQSDREAHQGAVMAIEDQMRRIHAQIMKG